MQTLLALMIVMATTGDIALEPCPASPNCVSSQATGSHFIEPFSISGQTAAAFDRLRSILERRHDTTIVAADGKTIRVEFKTVLGFVDDALFVLDVKNRSVQIRSAARAGYWDLGKNRRRLEVIRRQFQQK